jgi:hypothetical protein
MAVLNDQLYYAAIDHTSKNLLFAYGDPSFFTYGNVDLNLNGINADGEAAPALSAFNGDLYSAVLSNSGEIYIGKTVNGIIANFAFKTIGIPAGVTPTPRGNIALTYFVGKLYCAFIDVNGDAYLGSAADGLTYTFNKLGSTANPNIAFDAISLTSFNNKLYFAYNGQLGTSSDGETFEFSSVTGATGNPGIYTNVPVNFYRDIYPTLKTVTDYAWTNERAFHGHRPGTIAGFLRPDYLAYLENPSYADVNYSRPFVFGYIRPPAQATYIQNGDDLVKVTIPAPPLAAPKGTDSHNNPTGIFAGQGVQQVEQLMPRLFGNGGSVSENGTNGTNHPNQWLPLTNHQLEKLQKWVNGDFVTGDSNAIQYQDIPIPDQLDFAALQPTVGGGFHPGIELTYLMHYPDYFEGPFRFNQSIIPGSIAGYMSVPWQGDFWSCNISWWPALRPDIVVQSDNSVTPPALTYENWFRGNEIPPESDSVADYEGGYEIMLKSWPEFGLVTPVVGEYSIDQGQQVYQETERASSLDTPSYLANIDLNYVPTGSVLNNGNGTLTVSAISSGATEQQWKLIKSSTDAGYLFIEYVATGDVLTADFSTGSLTLEPKKTPSNSAQHWTYYASDTPEHPTGQPGQFMLKNQQNLQYLSVDENGNVSAQSSGETLWRLQATS